MRVMKCEYRLEEGDMRDEYKTTCNVMAFGRYEFEAICPKFCPYCGELIEIKE